MSTLKNYQFKKLDTKNSPIDTIKILSDITRRDLERSCNLDTVVEMTAHFSKKNGWTIRKVPS